MEEYYKHETTDRLRCDYMGYIWGATHRSPCRTSKRVVLVRVDVNAKAHTGCTTSSPTRYNLDHNLTISTLIQISSSSRKKVNNSIQTSINTLRVKVHRTSEKYQLSLSKAQTYWSEHGFVIISAGLSWVLILHTFKLPSATTSQI